MDVTKLSLFVFEMTDIFLPRMFKFIQQSLSEASRNEGEIKIPEIVDMDN